MQDKALLRDVRVVCEGPQGKATGHVNTALGEDTGDLPKWPSRNITQPWSYLWP